MVLRENELIMLNELVEALKENKEDVLYISREYAKNRRVEIEFTKNEYIIRFG